MQISSLLNQFRLYQNAPPDQEIPVVFHARVHAVNDRQLGNKRITLLMRDQNIFLRVHVDAESVHHTSVGVAQTCTLESILRVSGTLTLSNKHRLPEDNVIAGVVQASELVMISQVLDGLVTRPLLNTTEAHEANGEDSGCSDVLKLNERLNNRVLDIRCTARGSIFKLMSGVWELGVEFCLANGFQQVSISIGNMLVPTPGLIGYKIPGDDDYFPVSYYGQQQAWLAQTFEIHMQIALAMDFLPGCFNIGSVYRRESEISKRRLCEFTTLEVALPIEQDWTELLDKAEDLLIFVIRALQERERFRNLTTLAKRVCSSAGTFRLGLDGNGKMARLTFSESKRLLKGHAGQNTNEEDDLTPKDEADLGYLMRHHPPGSLPQTDIFILMEQPVSARGFQYHASMAGPSGKAKTTNSGDVILRGQEACTVMHCYHDSGLLRAAMQANDPPIDPDMPMLRPWIQALEAGAHPHGMFGVGLNRLLQGFLGLPDIHDTALFPRDANQLIP
ncbi:hypothetical protein MGN70_000876 [Eutypa lata]|nr:hypothetical protein MGN70_000876 [Eutypa lata]